MSVEKDAYRYAIRNAFQHHGRADMGALVGKLKALQPDADVKTLVPFAKAAIEKVNNMGMDEIRADYEKFEAEGFELKIPEKKVGLLDLDWAASEPVVTRYAPNPSAPPHLGHLRPAILSFLYAQKYGGKFILRFDDTDPKLKKPLEHGEKMYLEDLAWFGIVPAEIHRSSDRLDMYYSHMRKIVALGNAYVCTCDLETEVWKGYIKNHEACPCRELETSEQSARLEKMFTHEYKEGQAVLRIKTDLNHEDPSQIDWAMARIVDKPQHYRVKDKIVWPTYNFASAVDDHLTGVTLILRGQEHYQNMLKQKRLYNAFGWTYPHAFHHGRLLMKDTELSKSKMIAGIASGKYSGWDDPKLFTIRALQRKGYTPEGLINLIIDLGVKTSDTMVDLQLLATHNKPFVQDALTLSMIQDPVRMDVDFVPALEVVMEQKNYSLQSGSQPFYISRSDTSTWAPGTIVRLRSAYVVKITMIEPTRIHAQFVSTQKMENAKQIDWMLEGKNIRITMPDGKIIFGLTEESIENASTKIARMGDPVHDSMVHFSKFGFCRVDEKTADEIRLWFTHP